MEKLLFSLGDFAVTVETAVYAGVAVFASLNVLKPPAAASVLVVTVRHDIAAGAQLRADDVVAWKYPTSLAPAHRVRSVAEALGRTVTSSLSQGTPLTVLSLSGDAWSGLPFGKAAVPVRLQDSAVADLLRPGQHVRLAAIDPRNPEGSQTLVDDAVVLAVPEVDRNASAATGRLVVFEVPSSRSNLVTSAAVSRYLSVTWGY